MRSRARRRRHSSARYGPTLPAVAMGCAESHLAVLRDGVPGQRLNIQQQTRTPNGSGDVAGFIEDLVINILSPAVGGGKVLSFDTDRVLKTCQAWKQRGLLP
jgi:hypothetical protein